MPEGIYSLSHVFEGKRPGISIIPGGNAPSDKYRGASWHVFHCSCPQKAGSNGNGVGISSPHPAVTRPEAYLSLTSTMLILGTIRLKMMKAAR